MLCCRRLPRPSPCEGRTRKSGTRDLRPDCHPGFQSKPTENPPVYETWGIPQEPLRLTLPDEMLSPLFFNSSDSHKRVSGITGAVQLEPPRLSRRQLHVSRATKAWAHRCDTPLPRWTRLSRPALKTRKREHNPKTPPTMLHLCYTSIILGTQPDLPGSPNFLPNNDLHLAEAGI